MSQVNVLILNITDNSQRKRLQGVDGAGCVMPNLFWYCFVYSLDRAHPVTALLCSAVGAKDLQGMQGFQSWIKRQSCIAFWLILMIHGFQIWVHKIKNEKHAVLFSALQKEKRISYWRSFMFLMWKEDWFILRHDYKVSENNRSSNHFCKEKLHRDPTETFPVVVLIFITNQARNYQWSRKLPVASNTLSTGLKRRDGKPWNRDRDSVI